MQRETRAVGMIRTTSEITSFFEISFIHRASSLRRPVALLRAPFPLCFPISSSIYLRRLRLFQRSDIEDKKERCSRRHYVGPQDRSLLPVTPRSLIPTGSRESYEVPFGRSRGDSRISSSLCKFCFNFRVSPRSQRSRNSCKIAPRSYVDNKSLNTLIHVILARTLSEKIR